MLVRYITYGVDIFMDILPFNPEKMKYSHGKFRGKFSLVLLDNYGKLQKVNVNLAKITNGSWQMEQALERHIEILKRCMSGACQPRIMKQSIKSGIWLTCRVHDWFNDYLNEVLMEKSLDGVANEVIEENKRKSHS